jgi:hypothetical protein
MRSAFYLLAVTASVGMIPVAFLINAKIDGIVQKPTFREFRRSRANNQLRDLFLNSVWSFAFASAAFLVLALLDTDRQPRVIGAYVALWLVSLVIIRTGRYLWVLTLLARIAG